MPEAPRRRVRGAARAFALVLVALVSVELVLQLAALVAPDRSGAWDPDATLRVLAVGDSHTWGSGVEREDAYPAQLERRLDAKEPGTASVVNLGLPGMNTTQLRNRLGVWIGRYQPDVVVVWCGANNHWNHAELDRNLSSLGARIEGWLSRVRLYRLVRVGIHDFGLERYAVERPGDLRQTHEVANPMRDDEEWTVRHDGVTERVVHEKSPEPDDPERLFAQSLRDYEVMADLMKAAGVSPIFVTYPIETSFFEVVNRAMRAAGESRGVPVIESPEALARIPKDEVEWAWALHPDARLYGEIVADLAPVVAAARQTSGRDAEPTP